RNATWYRRGSAASSHRATRVAMRRIGVSSEAPRGPRGEPSQVGTHPPARGSDRGGPTSDRYLFFLFFLSLCPPEASPAGAGAGAGDAGGGAGAGAGGAGAGFGAAAGGAGAGAGAGFGA